MTSIPLSLWLSQLQFLLALLSFFAFFSAAALFFDSWVTVERRPLLLARALGFFLLALWAVLQGLAIASLRWAGTAAEGLLGVALALVAASYFVERLPGKPAELPVASEAPPVRVPVRGEPKKPRRVVAVLAVPADILARFLSPLLGFSVAGRLWYQAAVKLERGRKWLAAAFVFLSLSWLAGAVSLLPAVREGTLATLAEPFGMFWGAARVAEFLGVVLLLRWTWAFLRFRLFPQLYLTVVGAMLATTAVATIILVLVLAGRLQAKTLEALETNAKVFAFTIEELKTQVTLVAETLRSAPTLVDAVREEDRERILGALGNPIEDYDVGAVTVLNAGGEAVQVVGNGLPVGTSAGDDPVAVRAFQGSPAASALVREGPEVPTVIVRAGAPLVKDGNVEGSLLVDFPVDTAFLDRVQRLTGLTLVVYGGDRVAATTLRDAEGRPRRGGPGEDARITAAFTENGKLFRGPALLGVEPFLVAGLPLADIDNQGVGGLVVGLPEADFLRSIAEALRTSLVGSVLLMGVSLLPLYGVARVIARYQRA